MTKIATILTCFNRREITLGCLRRLDGQEQLEGVSNTVFLVDDGSTDGTSEAIRVEFPDVRIIEGPGDLFWNRGMHRAWAAALEDGPFDNYLLLNDDTHLTADAVRRLLDATETPEGGATGPSAAVGATVDPISGDLTYGGYVPASRWNPMKLHHRPLDSTKPVATMNCNAVMVSSRVVEQVGQMDPAFHHSWGDIDLGYRITNAGFTLSVPREPVGTCEYNEKGSAGHTDRTLSLRERYAYINSIKGLNRSDWLHLVRRHGGPLWPLVWASPYVHVLVAWFTQKILRRLRTSRSPKSG